MSAIDHEKARKVAAAALEEIGDIADALRVVGLPSGKVVDEKCREISSALREMNMAMFALFYENDELRKRLQES
jgi:hypothetical protein